jgi:hypothetical protein
VDIIPVAERAFCRRDKISGRETGRTKVDRRPDIFVTIDTETATDRTRAMPGFDGARWGWRTQNLLFGVARIGATATMTVSDEIIFYPDDLPKYGVEQLRGYLEARTVVLGPRSTYRQGAKYSVSGPERAIAPIPERRWRDEPDVAVWLMKRSAWLKEFFRISYKCRALVIGFNLPYDLARLASKWDVSKSRRNAGAWSLTLWTYLDHNGCLKKNPYRPNVTVKKTGPRRNFISFTGCQNDDPGPAWHGEFLDLGTLAFSLTARTYSLAGAVKDFCGRDLDKDVEHGIITPSYIDYARNDVRGTVALAKVLLELFDRHPVSRGAGGRLAETRCYSPASLAKAYSKSAGFQAPLVPEDRLGPSFAAFHGGWTETQLRGKPPVVLLDFKKMYQTQFILLGIQELLSAERLTFVDDTEKVVSFLDKVTLSDLFDPRTWPKLNVLCWVVPNDEILMTKGKFDGESFTSGMVPRDSGGKPVRYYLPDVILAKLLSGRAPRIVRAERIEGSGRRPLRKAKFPGAALAATLRCRKTCARRLFPALRPWAIAVPLEYSSRPTK